MGKKVAVIGAGASGLAALKCCLDEDLEATCFERSDRVGGLWAYREDRDGQGCVFKSTIINTSKEMMCYSDYPIPKDYPNFMHNIYIEKYFRSYVEHFGLKDHIKFHTEVENVTPAVDYDSTGRWKITHKKRDGGERVVEHFDAVMVCIGHHTTPSVPMFPGLEEFQGDVVHTHDYKTPFHLVDKQVVVIGLGNSGGDAAVELGRIASKVFLSTRSGAWVFNRLADYGYPVDIMITRRVIMSFPANFQNFMAQKKLQSKFDHARYGLQPAYGPINAHPFVNDDLPNRILSGAVVLKPNISRFTKTGVEFEDGSVEDNIDCVIMATGYTFSFPFIDCPSLKVEKNEVNLYNFVFPPDLKHPTICVIGCIQPWGAIHPLSELQSRWATRVFKGLAHLPSKPEMEASIQQRKDEMSERYKKSQRHTIQVDWIEYMDTLASEFGARPNLLKLFFTDPMLALRCFFGPCLPYQYRLMGPGKWNGAKEAIQTVYERIHAPLQTRTCNLAEQKSGLVGKLLRLSLLVLILCIFVAKLL
ncbi:dimethylaniline monooxygenase [N-oxide-forming] 5-like [Asterias rubens]|uniref:dimethylaniline monooxygenase [N-oxide-forming] 5-like n=1 Tax=Asterias rubens TaxID=7604 RepID=UPI00145516E9|nr:dimethylaniline monooxygenase [N-oxide-forming] 5-like [Asterias rubens]XP_033626298.1 dimethylaniline monooxygenase [N-oxide-forming] 5-like [Asterias rubens]